MVSKSGNRVVGSKKRDKPMDRRLLSVKWGPSASPKHFLHRHAVSSTNKVEISFVGGAVPFWIAWLRVINWRTSEEG